MFACARACDIPGRMHDVCVCYFCARVTCVYVRACDGAHVYMFASLLRYYQLHVHLYFVVCECMGMWCVGGCGVSGSHAVMGVSAVDFSSKEAQVIPTTTHQWQTVSGRW